MALLKVVIHVIVESDNFQIICWPISIFLALETGHQILEELVKIPGYERALTLRM